MLIERAPVYDSCSPNMSSYLGKGIDVLRLYLKRREKFN